MSEETFNPDEFNCKVDILFGNYGEHHLMLAGPSTLGITSFVHAMTDSEEMVLGLLRGIFDEVPDEVVADKIRNLPIEAAMSFMSGYPIEKHATVTTGMVMTEVDEEAEMGGRKFEGEEVTVGMMFTFAKGNNSLAQVTQDVTRLYSDHRLFKALVSACTGKSEDEINAVLVENES